jgi:pyruvate dehydrogenase E2 component (dihydrolipoamide acetyltransferase)
MCSNLLLESGGGLRQVIASKFMDVKLPKLGEGADSGVVVNVLVKEGDTVAKDQAILELENEKAVATIPSTVAGVVEKIHVKGGDRISVGQKILTLAGGAAPPAPAPATAATAPKAAAPKPAARPSPVPQPRPVEPVPETPDEIVNEHPVAPPSVRKMARELGIDLRKIAGSESGGRIVVSDVRDYIQRLMLAAARPVSAPAEAAPAKPVPASVDFSQWGPILKKPVSQLRKVIARRMSESWNTVARVTQFDDIDFTRVGELRK